MFCLVFLHELGAALFFAHVNPEEAFEYRHLGDISLRETYAFLFEYLTLDRGWLKRYLDFPKSKDFLFLAYLQKLYLLRRYAARLMYELELHSGGTVDGMPERYSEILTTALGCNMPAESFLYDVDRAFYSARYLRAWAFEALLCKHLCHYFDDDWYRNPRTGEFLRKNWALGHRYRVEEMAQEIGYDSLDLAPLEQEFFRNL